MPARIDIPAGPETNKTAATLAEEIANPVGNAELEPPDRKSASASKWDRGEQIVRIVAAFAVSLSAGLAAWQYWEGKVDETRERSLAILNQWQSSAELEAYRRLAEAVATTIEQTGPLPSELTGEAYMLAVNELGRRTMDRLSNGEAGYAGDWRRDIDALVEFYSTMEFCMDAGLCDEPILETYFAPSVVSFWDYFAPYGDTKRRQHYPRYGIDVNSLVERFASR